MHPQYKVSWIWNRICKACGVIHNEQFTSAYFTPEAAMDQAIFIRNNPEYTLLSVDQ
jgi:hypothetical protein